MASAAQQSSPLAEFIRSRRWFRSKTRTIQNAAVEDVIPMPGVNARILLVRIDYTEGDCDNYIVTDTGENPEQPTEALDLPAFRNQLLRAFQSGASLKGDNGRFVFCRTDAFREHGMVENLESSVSRAEQSNTSIIFGDRYIAKLFRKIESGINPDIEIGAFLTNHNFTHTPAVYGTLEYSSKNGQIYSAGILQQFVPNQGDAWKYTLDSLEAKATEDYLKSAALLGQRTAEMHIALASESRNPEFAPEPFTAEAGHKLQEEMLAQADIAFETLRRKQATLSGQAAELAQKLLHLEPRVTERFAALKEQSIAASLIRIHGDYHLGQVLWTGSDFMIIDFEGEPARPLNERRAKYFAMRDVAGMLRSFQYAAYTALPDSSEADRWNETVSAEYLRSYLHTAEGSVFLPGSEQERRVLLDAFILQKALYEVAYEMNNRPDWVRIPLRGILSLVAE